MVHLLEGGSDGLEQAVMEAIFEPLSECLDVLLPLLVVQVAAVREVKVQVAAQRSRLRKEFDRSVVEGGANSVLQVEGGGAR